MREMRDEALLTAYALGELPEAERKEIEARMAESEDLRRELQEIKETAAALRNALAGAPQVELSVEQRSAVEAAARGVRLIRFPIAGLLRRPAYLAVAASVILVGLGVGLLLWKSEPGVSRPAPSAAFGRPVSTPQPAASTPIPPVAIAQVAPAATAATRLVPSRHAALQRAGTPPLAATDVARSPTPVQTPASPRPIPNAGAPQVATTGALKGTVVDATGAALSAARVTLTNQLSGEVLSTVTNARGDFLAAGLTPGIYSARAEMPGFNKSEQTQIAVNAGAWIELAKMELAVRQMAGEITVTASLSELQTSTASMGMVASGRRSRKTPSASAAVVTNVTNGPRRPVASPLDTLRTQSADFNTEGYDHIQDNPFVLVSQDPRSTFSVDVDTASYSNLRRFLNDGSLPPKDAVRIEELVNYFTYDYAPPTGPHPFAVHMETAGCPWKPEHRLVRIGIKGRELPRGERPPTNLVFLLDVSGSMDQPNKLPLVQTAMKLLVGALNERDRVAIVVYAGAEGLALPSTSASEKEKILGVLDDLSPGGTTHGSAGLRLAYQIAEEHFIRGGANRVILATDGDFNVGVTNQGDLIRLIEEKAKSGVFLTALGFGMGNLKDSTLEKLADHGNGQYAYIDSLWEARRVLVEQIGATLVTIAKDVKLQLELNPATVKAFRLIGYENRVLAHQDFNDDKKDAGDIGAGHTVTALYEIVPAGGKVDVPSVDPLKYQQPTRPSAVAESHDLLTLKLRYKQADGERSTLIELALPDQAGSFEQASTDFRFAASVASFGMILRESPYKGDTSYANVLTWAKASQGTDPGSSRAEFLTLVEKARRLKRAR